MSVCSGKDSPYDVLLVQPPMEEFYLTAKRTVPYGLACIAAALIQKGFSVGIVDGLAVKKSRIIDPPATLKDLDLFYGQQDLSPFALFHHYRHYGYSFEHIGVLARLKHPFLVGVSSLFTAYSGEAMETARAVKRFLPECRVVMGGHHPTAFPHETMECQAVDFVLRGEGEESMPLLALALKNKTNLEDVPGIVFRRPDASLYVGEPAWVGDLDQMPLPATSLVDQDFYRRKKRGSISIVTARGCPMHCTYCSLGASSSHACFRRRTVASVMAELEAQMDRQDVGFIDFEDENLSLDRRWFLTLLNEISVRYGSRNVELRAMNGLYAPSLNHGVIAAMKEAGFKTLNLSLGSTCKEQLARFKRPNVGRSLDRCLESAETLGLGAVSYLIAAAPGQDPYQSVRDLVYLGARRTLVGLSIFYPAPGSHDFTVCRQRGLLPLSFEQMRSTAFPISDTTTRLEAATLLRLARILNFIKALKDEDDLPPPGHPGRGTQRVDPSNRRKAGKILLAGFLDHGRIQGVSDDGIVFDHPVSLPLVSLFLTGLAGITLRGVSETRAVAPQD
ncbi:MAG: radical SAM protein [Desulfobacterium sp.]|nr:radical SAM protein [Desulfobacterium sp.]